MNTNRKLKGDKKMDEVIMSAGTAIVSFIAGVGMIVIATIKGWWHGKTPEAKKSFVKVAGKALADGRISQEEYDEIIDEI